MREHAVRQAGYNELDLGLENGSQRCNDENVRYENVFYLKNHIIIEAYEKMPQ
jgi:hypothetical protein